MKVTVFSKKGGAGKTPLSYALAKDKGFFVATNEVDTYSGILDKSQVDVVDYADPFPDYKKNTQNVVFDLSGTIGKTALSILSAIKQSDVVVIPVFNDPISVLGFHRTVVEVFPRNQNIIVVATKIERSSSDKERMLADYTNAAEFLEIKKYIKREVEPSVGVSLPIFPTAKTKLYSRMIAEAKSMKELLEESPLQKRAWTNSVLQFNNFYNYLMNNYGSI